MTRFLPVLAAALALCASVGAQYENTLDGGTNITVDTPWTTNAITIGSTTVSNRLNIIDGGHVTNTTDTVIGGQVGADVNSILVKGANADMVTFGNLSVGKNGSENNIQILDGATFSTANAFIGEAAGASNNVAYVEGAGSRWDINGSLDIGGGGSNWVAVVDGGTIVTDGLNIQTNGGGAFYLSQGGAFRINNNFSADLAGFEWQDAGELVVAGDLDGMAVSNGYNFVNRNQKLVMDAGTWRTDTNTLVLGMGSAGHVAATNGGWIVVGEATTNGLAPGGGILVASADTADLVVSNGSSAVTDGTLYVGKGGSELGIVTITNGGVAEASQVQFGSNATNKLNVVDGGELSVTGDFDADVAGLNWAEGGTIRVGGALAKTAVHDGTRRTLALDGTNAVWDLGTTGLSVEGAGNSLEVLNGASVTNGVANVGTAAADSNNTVLVQGENSNWKINGTLNVGATNNTGNSVSVTQGGRIEVDGLNIQTNNSVVVENRGTLAYNGNFNLEDHPFLQWKANGELEVIDGDLTGMPTAEIVADGATNTAAILGGSRDLTLTGGSTQWTNGNNALILGYNNPNSDLVVSNGAAVSNGDGYIGWGTLGAADAVVTGTGSSWANNGNLFVGAYGSATNPVNTGGTGSLAVKDGAFVSVGGLSTNLPGMLVAGGNLVVGNGGVAVEDTLYLGQGGSLGTNLIRSGGSVNVGDLVIESGSYLDLQSNGTFGIEGGFDVGGWLTNGFNWGAGAELAVGGELTGMPTFATTGTTYNLLDEGRDLTLNGGVATNGLGWVVGLDGSGSDLNLNEGAFLLSGSTVIGYTTNANNNSITLDGGSTWVNNGDLAIGQKGQGNLLSIAGGSTNRVAGSATIGSAGFGGNRAVVDGSNSVWSVAQNLAVENGLFDSSSASLGISGGAQVAVSNELTLASNNSILLSDGGSLYVGQQMNLFSNTIVTGAGTIGFGDGASLVAFNGADIYLDTNIVFDAGVGSDTAVFTDSLFSVGPSTSNQFVNFENLQLNNSILEGNGVLGSAVFGNVSITNGVIDPNGDESMGVFLDGAWFGHLTIDGNLVLEGGTLYNVQVAQLGSEISNDLLIVNDPAGLDISKLDLGVYVPISPVGTNIAVITGSAPFLSDRFASTNIVDRMLLFDSKVVVDQAAGTAGILTEANNRAFSSALTYAGTEGVRAGYNGMKNTVFTRTKQLRRNLVSTAHSMPQEAFLMSQTNAPAGAQGPGDQNTIFDMHVWMQYFNGRGSYDSQGESYGFGINNGGTAFGADRLLGDSTVVGFNYTYARSDSRTTNGDYLDTETYWLGAYGEWVGDSGFYIDSLASIGFSNYQSVREEDNYQGTASYDGLNFGGYVDAGQYYYYKNFSLSPYIGLHALSASSEAYTETEAAGSQLEVDGYTRNWVESALGLKARHRFDTRIGRFQTTGYAEWTHDFIQDDIYATMSANGLPPVDMARITPDSDLLNAGLGFSWICTDYMEIGIGYNGRFSERYEEHAGSLMVDIMF